MTDEAPHRVHTGVRRETRLELTLKQGGGVLTVLYVVVTVSCVACRMLSCPYLVHILAVCPVAGGPGWTGSTGEPRVVETLRTGDALVAGVRRATRTRLMKTCRDAHAGFNQVLR